MTPRKFLPTADLTDEEFDARLANINQRKSDAQIAIAAGTLFKSPTTADVEAAEAAAAEAEAAAAEAKDILAAAKKTADVTAKLKTLSVAEVKTAGEPVLSPAESRAAKKAAKAKAREAEIHKVATAIAETAAAQADVLALKKQDETLKTVGSQAELAEALAAEAQTTVAAALRTAGHARSTA